MFGVRRRGLLTIRAPRTKRIRIDTVREKHLKQRDEEQQEAHLVG